MSKLYLVMNSFSGRYLGERSKKNIGHENINFFMPTGSDGKYFLWFNCDGIFPSSRTQDYDGEINLLMVTNFANEKDKFRVLAYAKNCHLVEGAIIPGQKEDAKNRRHRAFMENYPNAKYGNAALEDIFADNTYQGNPDSCNTLATFYTEPQNILAPVDQSLTIQIKNTEGADIKQNMANEKMRMYIKDNEAFENLINSFEWQCFDAERNILPGYEPISDFFKEEETFFTATRNDKDELSLSNIVAYSLSNSDELFRAFVNTLVGVIPETNADYSIKREDKHVDLTIMLPDRTIIIENKIDSTVIEEGYETVDSLKEKVLKAFAGYKPPKEAPKRESYRIAYEEKISLYDGIKEKIHDLVGDYEGPFCQLSKYYIQSKIDAFLNDRENLPIHYFFLVPNYTKNKFQVDDDNFIHGWPFSSEYKRITYEDVFNIFNHVQNYPYRDDILKEFNLLMSNIDNADQNWQIYNFLRKAGL